MVCDYHDASYSVRILNGHGIVVHQTNESTYSNNRSNSKMEIVLMESIHLNAMYTAVISISTAVNSTETKFKFSEITNINFTKMHNRILLWLPNASKCKL